MGVGVCASTSPSTGREAVETEAFGRRMMMTCRYISYRPIYRPRAPGANAAHRTFADIQLLVLVFSLYITVFSLYYNTAHRTFADT